MRIGLLPGFALAVLALAGILVVIAHANTASTIVTGSVTVRCPFVVAVSPSSPVYVAPARIYLNYSARSVLNCTTSLVSGNVIISNSTTGFIFNETSVSFADLGTAVQKGTASYPSNSQMSGTVNAVISLSSSTNYNTSESQFLVVAPANLTVSQFSASPNPAKQGQTMTFTSNVFNNGGLTASNVTVHIKISGPNSFSYVASSPVLPLSPGQYEITTIMLTGVSGSAGTYTARENASFNSSYVFNSVTYNSPTLYSNNVSVQYSVPSTPPPPPPISGGGGTGVPPPLPKSIGGITLAQFPIYMSLFPGNVTINYIGVTNNKSYSQWVNFTPVKQPSFDSIVLSSNSMLVQPFSTSYITMATTISRNASPGSYLELLGLKVSAPGQMQNATLFYKVDVQQTPTAPALSSTVILLNNSKNAELEYTLVNPTNKTYQNLLVTTAIPAVALLNNSRITQSGAVTSATLLNNTYYLEWMIQQLGPHASTSAFSAYIQNISKTSYIISPVTSFSQAPPLEIASIFRLLVLNSTHVYVNGTSLIKFEALYTGTSTAKVTFNVVPPFGVSINRTFASQNVSPNQQITEYFMVGPLRTAGTETFNIYVNVSQQQLRYTIPIVVQAPPQQTGSVQEGVDLVHNQYRAIAVGILSLLAMVAVIAVAGKKMSSRIARGYHERRRSGRIQMIKRRLKEGGGHGGGHGGGLGDRFGGGGPPSP